MKAHEIISKSLLTGTIRGNKETTFKRLYIPDMCVITYANSEENKPYINTDKSVLKYYQDFINGKIKSRRDVYMGVVNMADDLVTKLMNNK